VTLGAFWIGKALKSRAKIHYLETLAMSTAKTPVRKIPSVDSSPSQVPLHEQERLFISF
jgi:hypothetical protein